VIKKVHLCSIWLGNNQTCPKSSAYFSSGHPTSIVKNHFTFQTHYNTKTRISNSQPHHLKMKWASILAFAAFALGASAAAVPAEAAEAVPEALYISPIKYAEFEEDA
jgi:hypothetical protein